MYCCIGKRSDKIGYHWLCQIGSYLTILCNGYSYLLKNISVVKQLSALYICMYIYIYECAFSNRSSRINPTLQYKAGRMVLRHVRYISRCLWWETRKKEPFDENIWLSYMNMRH